MHPYSDILLGAVVMGDLVAGLFFLRYWKVTGDRFFLFFAASFAAAAASRVIVDQNIPPFGMEPLGHVVRFLSYLIILVGIVDKNRAGARTAMITLVPRRQ